MGIWEGLTLRTAKTGFTLVELLLVVALLLVTFAAVVFNFNTLGRGVKLDEGAGQVETLLRFARAQASSSGRQVRVFFGATPLQSGGSNAPPAPGASAAPAAPVAGPATGPSSTGDSTNLVIGEAGLAVGWEPDPLGAPGRFEPLREAAAYLDHLATMVRVRETWPPFSATNLALPFGGASTTGIETTPDRLSAPPVGGEPTVTNGPIQVPAVTFYPDGSSDSVEIVLESQDDDDTRRIAISLSGLSGAIRRRALILVEGEVQPDDGSANGFPVHTGGTGGAQ